MDPTAIATIVGLALAVLGIIVRGEVRSNQNASDVENLATKIDDLYDRWDSHTSNRDIHPDGEELNRKMTEIQKTMQDGFSGVNQRIDQILLIESQK